MDRNRAAPDAPRDPALPGARTGEGTQTLWEHMARDELQKTSNRGAGQRELRPPEPVVPRGRRATDEP